MKKEDGTKDSERHTREKNPSERGFFVMQNKIRHFECLPKRERQIKEIKTRKKINSQLPTSFWQQQVTNRKQLVFLFKNFRDENKE